MENDTEFVCSNSEATISPCTSVTLVDLISHIGRIKPMHVEHDINGLQRSLQPLSLLFSSLFTPLMPSHEWGQQSSTSVNSSEPQKVKSNIGATFSSSMCKTNNIDNNLTRQNYKIFMIRTKPTPFLLLPLHSWIKRIWHL